MPCRISPNGGPSTFSDHNQARRPLHPRRRMQQLHSLRSHPQRPETISYAAPTHTRSAWIVSVLPVCVLLKDRSGVLCAYGWTRGGECRVWCALEDTEEGDGKYCAVERVSGEEGEGEAKGWCGGGIDGELRRHLIKDFGFVIFDDQCVLRLHLISVVVRVTLPQTRTHTRSGKGKSHQGPERVNSSIIQDSTTV